MSEQQGKPASGAGRPDAPKRDLGAARDAETDVTGSMAASATSQEPPGCRSGRSWEIGEGHLASIRDARIRSVDEIEQLEGQLVEARRVLIAAQEETAAALRARTAASEAVKQVEGRLFSARRRAVYRLASSSDISRPADRRGPEHDLDDLFLDEVPHAST